MSVSYKKLWKKLIDQELKKTDLVNQAGISTNVLARMGHNEPVSLASLEKLCAFLSCEIGDIIEFENKKRK